MQMQTTRLRLPVKTQLPEFKPLLMRLRRARLRLQLPKVAAMALLMSLRLFQRLQLPQPKTPCPFRVKTSNSRLKKKARQNEERRTFGKYQFTDDGSEILSAIEYFKLLKINY